MIALRVVGRPILYVLIDVFSSIIAGFALTLENASWNAATLAYVNMLQNKVDFCKSQDIIITEDQWPVHHKPHSVFADRFETLSINSDSLIRNFGIVVANAPPYRPEYKSSVEREFRLINHITLKDQPGFVPKNIKRGDPDYRVEAALNLEELRLPSLTYLFFRPVSSD